jgi:multicomponent Na+:H+ antiporter subunit E
MYLVFHPRMRDLIDPQLITFETTLESDVAQTTLGNSITLTPGTFTVLTRGQTFTVHAISGHAAAGLPGEMERRIARVFREET